jgi:hypothetical protein
VRPFYRWYYDYWYPYFLGYRGGGGYYRNRTNLKYRRDRPFKHRQQRSNRDNNDNRSYGGKKVSNRPHKISNKIHKLKRNTNALRYRLRSSTNTFTPVKHASKK